MDIIRQYLSVLPRSVLEELYSWSLISCHGFLTCSDNKNRDDKEIVQAQCHFLRAFLQVILHSKIKIIDQEFVIDLWTLGNFNVISSGPLNDLDENDFEEDNPFGLVSSDEYVSENQALFDLGDKFLPYLQDVNDELESFQPKFFILDRHLSDTNDRQKTSLVWNNPRALITVVDNCKNLKILNLEGFQDLNDLVLEYIVGATPQNHKQGLYHLIEITLPKKSFATVHGHLTLLKGLPQLQRLIHDGKMGQIFGADLELDFEHPLNVTEFSQLESMRSGGILDIEEWAEEDLGLEPWVPTPECVDRIRHFCPKLSKLRVLMNDQDLEKFVTLENLEEIEAHVTWTGISGLDLLSIHMKDTLTKINLVLLEGYSWSVVAAIGKYCQNVQSFHLNIWTEYIEDLDQLDTDDEYFPKLEEFNLTCEEYVEELSEVVFAYFFQCRGNLKLVQYVAPLNWLTDEYLHFYCESKAFCELEMLVVKNTSDKNLSLGLESANNIIKFAPNLVALGDLRSWKGIDYYNEESQFYFKSESEFSKLKREIQTKNWDLDLDVESIDYLWTK